MTLFQLVTLPVEYDASRRAKEQLFRLGLVHEQERAASARFWTPRRSTYVAALVSSVLRIALSAHPCTRRPEVIVGVQTFRFALTC